MKKVLIISYFYPPANFAGSQRTASWAKYLHKHGFYPIVITRQWNQDQTDLIDKVENNVLEIEYNSSHEIHRLPYKRSLRDRCSAHKWLRPLQKFLTLYELIASNFSIRALPYSNFYTYSNQFIKENPDISIVIASGRPFQSFSIGHKLKKGFPNIHWVPDYRDEWTTNHLKSNNGIFKLINKLDRKSEKRWTQNATAFITVSNFCEKNISKLIGIGGYKVMNGYELDDTSPIAEKINSSSNLNIQYLGTLYSNQNIELIISSLEKLKDVTLSFVGSEINADQKKRLSKLNQNFSFIETLPRLPKENMYKKVEEADLLLLTNYKGLEECLPVKIFEYFKLNKPILLCPSDNDVMGKFIKETNSGYIASSEDECISLLKSLIQKKQNNQPLMPQRNESAAEQYTRQHQTKVLADVLDKLSLSK